MTARYCWLPRAVSGAKPVIKKCRRGKGTKWTMSDDPSTKKEGRTHVDGKFPEVRVELTREAQTCCDARHDNRDEVIKITVGGCGEFQSVEVDVIKCFVIDAERLI